LQYRYTAYGLVIDTDRQLSGVREISRASEAADLFIHFETRLPTTLHWQAHSRFKSTHHADQGDQPALRILESSDGEWTRLAYIEGMQFTVDHAGRVIWVEYEPAVPFDYVQHYLLNTMVGLALRLREVVCLHASAIEMDGRAYLIAGDSGAGKSTTSLYCLLQGQGFLSDNLSVLTVDSGGLSVQAGIPRLRLTPTSSHALFGTILPPLVNRRSKTYIELEEYGVRTVGRALPLGGVYILTTRANRLAISPLEPKLAFITLMNHVYLRYLLDYRARSVDTVLLARLAQMIPVTVVTPQDDLNALPALYAALVADATRARPPLSA